MNLYILVSVKILDIVKYIDKEWIFRVNCNIKGVLFGKFYEIFIFKYGESLILVLGYGEDYIDFIIRNVGKVISELFNYKEGDFFFIRGFYGNGFDVFFYEGREIVVVVGGSVLVFVRGIVEYFYNNKEKCEKFKLIVGFKLLKDILFVDDLKRWSKKFDILVIVDGVEEGYSGNVGLVIKYILELDMKDINNIFIVVVGFLMMMKFIVEEFLKRDLDEKNIWVFYERKMCCGIGKCGYCKMDDIYICLDGLVFDYLYVKNFID